MGQKDVVSKEILKNIARDISKHILHIEVKEDMELIRHKYRGQSYFMEQNLK